MPLFLFLTCIVRTLQDPRLLFLLTSLFLSPLSYLRTISIEQVLLSPSLLSFLHSRRRDQSNLMDTNNSPFFISSSPPASDANAFMHDSPSMVPNHPQQPQDSMGGMTDSRSNFMQLQHQQLRLFWQQQMLEVQQISEFKQHQLPLARIKKIMKTDEEVKMISAEAPILFAKACELFILELTLRSWSNTEANKRRTLQRTDIADAISQGEILDFLVDVVSTEDMKDEDAGASWMGNEPFPYMGMHLPYMQPPPFNQNLHPDDEMAILIREIAEEREKSLILESNLELYHRENEEYQRRLEVLGKCSANEIVRLRQELGRIRGASSSSQTSEVELQSLKETLTKNAEEILKLQLDLARNQGQLMMSEKISHHFLSQSQSIQSGPSKSVHCPRHSVPCPRHSVPMPSAIPTTSTASSVDKQGCFWCATRINDSTSFTFNPRVHNSTAATVDKNNL